MRRFIKKLLETNKGSKKVLTNRELLELTEFVENKGYYIVAENNQITLNAAIGEHRITFPLTEYDAVRIFKKIHPQTHSRKTPLEKRYKKAK